MFYDCETVAFCSRFRSFERVQMSVDFLLNFKWKNPKTSSQNYNLDLTSVKFEDRSQMTFLLDYVGDNIKMAP